MSDVLESLGLLEGHCGIIHGPIKSILALLFLVLTSLTHLDELLYVMRQGLPMKMLLDGLDGSSLVRLS